MSKDKISDYSSTADSNTDVGGIGIKGTDPVHNMDNGLREIMSHLADMNEGIFPLSDALTIGAQSDEVSGLDKQVRFDASSVTKGEKRVLKVPDTDGTFVVSDDNGALLIADSEGNAVDIDATLLNGQSSSHYLDAANLTGTILDANLPTEMSGNAATATNATDHIAQTDNPHSVTKTQIGLGNVDNTSDVDKPISTAVQTELNGKANIIGGLLDLSQLPVGFGSPSGAVMHFATTTAPIGWLKADGAAVSRANYADLFAAIGVTFGGGDGVTTFNTPDLRGEFIRGMDDGRGIDAGRVFGSSQDDALQGHKHTSPIGYGSGPHGSYNPSYGGTIFFDQNGGYTASALLTSTPDYTDSINGTPRVADETRPRNIALLACIKY